MSELPDGWTTLTLGQVAGKGQYGWTTKASQEGQVRFLRTTDITKGSIDWDKVPYCQQDPQDPEKYLLKGDDILISRAGSVGFSALISETPEPTVFASYMIRYLPDTSTIFPKYLLHYLSSPNYWDDISGAKAGIALANVNAQQLAALEVPIAPLAEQKRIADKLDAVLARVDACREKLERVPGILTQFRQSVLQAATTGELTKDWREERKTLPSSEELLRDGISRHMLHAEKLKIRPSKDAVETILETEILPDLPGNWIYAAAATVVEPGAEIVYGIVQPGEKLDDGIPYVRGKDIQDGVILVDQLLKTSPEIAQRYERASLQGGDVLLGIIRATKVAIVPDILMGANITQGTARLRPSEAIRTEYLAYALEAPQTQFWLHEHYRGIDMPGLNLADVRKTPIPLPSLEEQDEIIRRVRELLKQHRAAMEAYERGMIHVSRLSTTLLAKAFRGELVPQDPAGEPASVLLERLNGTSKPRPTKRGSKKTPNQSELFDPEDVPQTLQVAEEQARYEKE